MGWQSPAITRVSGEDAAPIRVQQQTLNKFLAAQEILMISNDIWRVQPDDGWRMLAFTANSGVALYVPPDQTAKWSEGVHIDIFQHGTGQVCVYGDAGVTIMCTPGNGTRAQYSAASLIHGAAPNEWWLVGDLATCGGGGGGDA